jgi:hypothetical protein
MLEALTLTRTCFAKKPFFDSTLLHDPEDFFKLYLRPLIDKLSDPASFWKMSRFVLDPEGEVVGFFIGYRDGEVWNLKTGMVNSELLDRKEEQRLKNLKEQEEMQQEQEQKEQKSDAEVEQQQQQQMEEQPSSSSSSSSSAQPATQAFRTPFRGFKIIGSYAALASQIAKESYGCTHLTFALAEERTNIQMQKVLNDLAPSEEGWVHKETVHTYDVFVWMPQQVQQQQQQQQQQGQVSDGGAVADEGKGKEKEKDAGAKKGVKKEKQSNKKAESKILSDKKAAAATAAADKKSKKVKAKL